MGRSPAVVDWSCTPEGWPTVRAGRWRYTVHQCRSGWVWVRAPAYEALSGTVQIHEAESEDDAKHAVEEAIASAASSWP